LAVDSRRALEVNDEWDMAKAELKVKPLRKIHRRVYDAHRIVLM
jgi:hypothetical protein